MHESVGGGDAATIRALRDELQALRVTLLDALPWIEKAECAARGIPAAMLHGLVERMRRQIGPASPAKPTEVPAGLYKGAVRALDALARGDFSSLGTVNEDYQGSVDEIVGKIRDLAALRRSHGDFLRGIKAILGFENWPEIKGDFLDGVLAILRARLRAAGPCDCRADGAADGQHFPRCPRGPKTPDVSRGTIGPEQIREPGK